MPHSLPSPTMDGLKEDAFLTGLLGVSAHLLGVTDESSPEGLAAAATRIRAGDSFTTAKVPTSRIDLVDALQRTGFSVVDVNVTLRREPQPTVPALAVREATPEDADAVRALAHDAFSITRFHLDPRVRDDVADEIKATWAANFFTGQRGDAMLIADTPDGPAGFLQILDRPDHSVIDLVGVAAEARGHGIGAALVHATAARHPDLPVLVGTQVANTRALAFYERQGFRTVGTTYVLHRHGDAT